jgi:D-inositol-3-phosphate glycosyltransferase
MAAGKPVIGVKCGGVQELILHGETGFLVPPKDVRSLVQATEQLLNQPVSRQAMGENARAYACEHFSLEKHSASIQALYHNLSSRR